MDLPYDIAKDRLLYTIGNAHSDRKWLWDYPTTNDHYLPGTMKGNILLLEGLR